MCGGVVVQGRPGPDCLGAEPGALHLLPWHSLELLCAPCCPCRGPGTAFEFALALVRELYGEEKMREVAGPMVMAPGWDKAL